MHVQTDYRVSSNFRKSEEYSVGHILHEPLTEASLLDRLLLRSGLFVLRRFVVRISGLANIHTKRDPFILVANHSQRLEAIILPLLLAFHRNGNFVEFLSDWNFRIIPGLSFLLRRARTIPVGIKPAKPAWLGKLKPLVMRGSHGYDAAKQRLRIGASIGIFPEGTVNRDSSTLLRGHIGAARLAIETGVAIVPAGIRFPFHDRSKPIPDHAPMAIEIGDRIYPPKLSNPEPSDFLQLHHQMMRHISFLSGKQWTPQNPRSKHDLITIQH